MYIQRNLDEKELPEEFRAILTLWGSDDSYFEFPEIAKILETSISNLKYEISRLKTYYPNTYKYYAKRRQEVRKQQRFEEYGEKTVSNDWLDEHMSWDENSKDTKTSTNSIDSYKHSRNKEED